MTTSKTFLRGLWVVIWASPNTALGLTLGMLALLTGGKMQLRRGCFEFYGGMTRWWLSRLIGGEGAAAMTLGHTILGQTPSMLRRARDHEHVHVRQYERWGPFFLPAYLGISAWLWLVGRDCYLENPFEIEAYAVADVNTSDDEEE